MLTPHVPERGERGIRALNRARRARAKRPDNVNEAVSYRMDEALAKTEAEAELKVPEDLIKSCGEALQTDFRLSHIVDTLQNPDMVNVIASEHRVDLAACVGSRVAETAIDAAESVQASNSLEKMLCHQMAAAHRAAMKITARSLAMDGVPAEMARLSNAAARMMQVYQEALLTLQKLRTGGKQTFVVQHVQVSEGGQAVIAGSMKTGGRKDRQGVGSKNEGNTP
jgi:hypothetical protein